MGVVILALELLNGKPYNNGWFGMVYAGLTYSYFAVLLSSIPTIVFGLPAILIAKKYNILNIKIILIGATVLGALFLSLGGMIYSNFDKDFFVWSMLVGALGGLLNGYVFYSRLEPNKAIKKDV